MSNLFLNWWKRIKVARKTKIMAKSMTMMTRKITLMTRKTTAMEEDIFQGAYHFQI